MNMRDKLALAVTGVEAVACGVFAALCYAKAQYHQGRIDAVNERHEEMLKLKKEMIQK